MCGSLPYFRQGFLFTTVWSFGDPLISVSYLPVRVLGLWVCLALRVF